MYNIGMFYYFFRGDLVEDLSKKNYNQKLLDPDIASLLNLSFAGLGGIGGIYTVMTFMGANRKEKKVQEANQEIFKTELEGFLKVVSNIESNLNIFSFNVRNLGKLIVASNRRQPNNLFHETVRYGSLSLLLSEYEYSRYEILQKKIYESLSDFNSNILIIEKFLQEFSEYMVHEDRLKIISSSERLVKILNDITFNSELTVGEFIDILEFLTNQIPKTIHIIREAYKKDRMLGY